jgi:hypothetical protein
MPDIQKTADRKISAVITIGELPFGFALQIRDEDGVSICLAEDFEKNLAKTEQTEKTISKNHSTLQMESRN